MNENLQPIIVDSSGLISLLIDTDSNHQKAIHAVEKYSIDGNIVAIPNDVFAECINVLGKKMGHMIAVSAAKKISESTVFQIVDADDPLRQTALDEFEKQTESVSYTDCVVMALAKIWKTKKIFGFDQTFKTNGFETP